jgi:hypothetical protein
LELLLKQVVLFQNIGSSKADTLISRKKRGVSKRQSDEL